MSLDALRAAFDAGTIITLAPIVFIANFVFATIGFGGGVVGTPIAAQFVEPRFALSLFALFECLITVRILVAGAGDVARRELAGLIPACLVGVGLGTLLLVRLPVPALMLAMGVFVCLFVLHRLWPGNARTTVSRRWAPVAGFAGGIASAVFGAGGPPYAIYLSLRPLSVAQMRATLAANGVVSVGARVVAFALAGLYSTPRVWIAFITLLPVMILAIVVAERLARRIPRAQMTRAVYLLLVVSGASLIVRALAGS
ncbi:MAG: sulfite exporter TauE/SafE family protein [Burkholderiaceae bacterium]|nr:sulfite exporter TauE/SafE family protein [Burkholderiaceae bacterium]